MVCLLLVLLLAQISNPCSNVSNVNENHAVTVSNQQVVKALENLLTAYTENNTGVYSWNRIDLVNVLVIHSVY